jgi:type II secretory pathway pseudopilin PulG
MKTTNRDQWRMTDGNAAAAPLPRFPGVTRWALAFTIVELLTVMAVIGILAAMLFPAMGRVTRAKYLNTARAEMGALDTAIGNYHADYGFYPPGSTNVLINQLYYELEGTYTNAATGTYVTLDGGSQLPISGVNGVSSAFGIGGFFNTGATNRGEDIRVARTYLPDLRQNQLATNGNGVKILVFSFGGPDNSYQPMAGFVPGFTSLVGNNVNPWRYNPTNPTNNPASYDLWVQLVIGRTTNLVCNWNKNVQLNSPLP